MAKYTLRDETGAQFICDVSIGDYVLPRVGDTLDMSADTNPGLFEVTEVLWKHEGFNLILVGVTARLSPQQPRPAAP